MFEVDKGVSFREACELAKNECYNKGFISLIMKFNHITLNVSKDSNIDDLSTIYYLKSELYRYQNK